VKEYYDTRAPEYDEWWHAAARDRPGWREELDAVRALLAALPPARTLDVACGTGYLTQHLSGEIVALDQSVSMLELARERVPHAELVVGDALALPFDDGAFDRLFASYFYCHLEPEDAARFRAEARRVARELIVMGSNANGVEPMERWEERRLNDGSAWQVYKRVFDPAALAAELGGDVLHAGTFFVLVRS
jgi:ubiquinone/menaquinone biosynthesis C-methylase UbiE